MALDLRKRAVRLGSMFTQQAFFLGVMGAMYANSPIPQDGWGLGENNENVELQDLELDERTLKTLQEFYEDY